MITVFLLLIMFIAYAQEQC